jgi:hypothetical protein
MGRGLERRKGDEGDHLLELCEVRDRLLDRALAGADLIGQRCAEERIARRGLEQHMRHHGRPGGEEEKWWACGVGRLSPPSTLDVVMASDKAKGKRRAVDGPDTETSTRSVVVRFTDGDRDLTVHVGPAATARDVKDMVSASPPPQPPHDLIIHASRSAPHESTCLAAGCGSSTRVGSSQTSSVWSSGWTASSAGPLLLLKTRGAHLLLLQSLRGCTVLSGRSSRTARRRRSPFR